MIRPDELSKFLDYDLHDGRLFWRERGAEHFSGQARANIWNAKHAGKEAFINTDGAGYRAASIMGRRYLAHRVLWAIYSGEWPKDQIDHINGIRTDNRIANLRQATPAQNQMNRRATLGASNYRGVSWYHQTNRWCAKISCDRKRFHLGYFQTEREAAEAYDRKAIELYGVYARLNFPMGVG